MSANPALQPNLQPRAEELTPIIGVALRANAFPLRIRLAHPLSEDALLELSSANDAVRLERTSSGELLVMTPVGGNTSNKEVYLARELDLWAERDGKGLAFGSNAGFSLPDGSVLSPDAAWLSAEKWNALTAEQQSKYVPFCPEFIIELRSPSDRAAELEEKMLTWIGNGAQLAWLIDPTRKLAMIYRPGQEPETLLQPEVLEGDAPIAGFRLTMQRLWRI